MEKSKEISIFAYQYSLSYFQDWINAQKFIMGLYSKGFPFLQGLDNYSTQQLQNLEKKVNCYNQMNFIKRWWLKLTSPLYKDINDEKAILLLLLLRQKVNTALLNSSQSLIALSWENNHWLLYHQLSEIISILNKFFHLKTKRLYHFLGEKNKEAIKWLHERSKVTDILLRRPIQDIVFHNPKNSNLFKKLFTKIRNFFSHKETKMIMYKLSRVKEKPRQKQSEKILNLNEIEATYKEYYNYLKHDKYAHSTAKKLKENITKSFIHFFINISFFPIEPDARYFIKKLAKLQLKWDEKINYLEKTTQRNDSETEKIYIPKDEDNSFISPEKLMDWLSTEQIIISTHPLFEQQAIKNNFIIPFTLSQLKLWLRNWDIEIDNQTEIGRISFQICQEQKLNAFFEALSILIKQYPSPILTFSDLSVLQTDKSLYSSKNYFMNAYSKFFPSAGKSQSVKTSKNNCQSSRDAFFKAYYRGEEKQLALPLRRIYD